MTPQEKIALTSAAIAAMSLAANLVMAVIIYKLNRRNLRRDEVVAVLKSVLHRLEYTRLFDVDPDQEIWEFGFESLSELASLCAPAHLAAQSGKYVSNDVREAV